MRRRYKSPIEIQFYMGIYMRNHAKSYVRNHEQNQMISHVVTHTTYV